MRNKPRLSETHMGFRADDNVERSGEARDEIMIMYLNQNTKKCIWVFFRILTF